MAVGEGKAGGATDVSGRNIAQVEVAWGFVGTENAIVDAIGRSSRKRNVREGERMLERVLKGRASSGC